MLRSGHRPLAQRPLRSRHALESIAVMWILEAQSLGSNDERSVRVQTTRHYLTAGSHVVGRNVTPGQSNIIVAEDKSISRGHAVINVKYAEQASFQVRGASCNRLLSLAELEYIMFCHFRHEPVWDVGEQGRAKRCRNTCQGRRLAAVWTQVQLQVGRGFQLD